MPTYGITPAAVGVTLETDGTIYGIQCTLPPPPGRYDPPTPNPSTGISTGRNLTLVDDAGPGQPRQLLNVDPATSSIQRGGILMWNSSPGIPFRNLTVGSVPPGSQWEVSTL
jgi:hypothetical protein